MNEKQRIAITVELTEYEIDVVTDYAEDRMNSLEEFLTNAAEERAREIAYAIDWSDDDILSDEEIEEFTNNFHNDRLIDFLRDARQDGDE